MSVLGAEFIKPDFDAGTKLLNAKAARAEPFRESMERGNKWIKHREEARVATTKAKQESIMEQAKFELDMFKAKSDAEFNSARATKMTIEAKTKQSELVRQEKVDAQGMMNMETINGIVEKYIADPSSVSKEEIRNVLHMANALKGTSSEQQGAKQSAFLTGIMNDKSTDFIIENTNKAETAASEGRLYVTQENADAKSLDGMLKVVGLVTGDGARYEVTNELSIKGKAKADAILDEMEDTGKTRKDLSREDREILNIARRDDDIDKRMDAMSGDRAAIVTKKVKLPDDWPQDAFQINGKVSVLDEEGNPVDIFDLAESDPETGSGRKRDFADEPKAKNEDGTFKDEFVVINPPFATRFERLSDDSGGSIYVQSRTVQIRTESTRDFSKLIKGEGRDAVLGGTKPDEGTARTTNDKADAETRKATQQPVRSSRDISTLF